MTHPTADWNHLGSEFYRRVEMCQMNWIDDGIDLNKFKIFADKNGGNIAVLPMDKNDKIVKLMTGSNHQSKVLLFIFSGFGNYISSIKLDTDSIVAIGWSHKEDLILVCETGQVWVYNIFGELQKKFKLLEGSEKSSIIQCKILNRLSSTCIVILTEFYKFYVSQGVEPGRCRYYNDVPKSERPPQCWEPFYTRAEELQILFFKDSNLFLVTQFKCEQLFIAKTISSNILDISISQNSKYIALYLDTGILWFASLEGSQTNRINDFATKSGEKPDFMVWCGNEVVCTLWKRAGILLLVGLEKEWMNYYMGGPVYLVSECDGVRVITKDTNEIIQKVPDELVQIFRPGSISAGALLMEACKEFEKRNYKAYEYIRTLQDREEIELAVQQCTIAAGHEFQLSTQKMLLRAAAFGKNYVPELATELFCTICKDLRILNMLRDKSVLIPLTYEQLTSVPISTIIDRLVRRRHYFLAIKLAKYLKIKEDQGVARILRNWALYKIANHEYTDEEIGRDLIRKIDPSSGVSFAEIAEQAIKEKRMELAIILLNREFKSSRQVPLLLELKQNEQALKKASESGESDLIHMVIHTLGQELRKDFLTTLKRYPDAYSLYKKHLQDVDMEKLYTIYLLDGDFNERGYSKVKESLRVESIPERKRCLTEAQECFRKAKNDFAVLSTEDQLRLFENQEKLESKCKQPFVGLSLQETIQRLLREKEEKLAESLKKDFKVPDRRYWWLKINILAQQRDWPELEKLSKLKKSPIGYEPFVSVCLQQKNKAEAQKYVHRVREEYKISYYVKVGMLEDAAKFAFMTKNKEALDFVAKKCGPGSRQLLENIDAMKKQLT